MIIFGRKTKVRSDSVIPELENRIKHNLFLLQDISRKDYKEILKRYVMLVKMLEEEI